eukprot:347295-Prymnesium_polylepis.2
MHHAHDGQRQPRCRDVLYGILCESGVWRPDDLHISRHPLYCPLSRIMWVRVGVVFGPDLDAQHSKEQEEARYDQRAIRLALLLKQTNAYHDKSPNHSSESGPGKENVDVATLAGDLAHGESPSVSCAYP